MGRSVAVPGNAAATVFIDVSGYDSDTWDDFIEDLQGVIQEKYPSFTQTDRWVGRETRAILHNTYALIVVSEYMGLASVSIGPAGEHGLSHLSQTWCNRVASAWRKHLHKRYAGTVLRHLGTFSNGEGVYERVA